jgi:CRP-like cAMP-binding protein
MPRPRALERFLDKIVERSVLTDAEQQAILDLPTRPVTYNAREDIVQLGQVTNHSWLIADGIAARFAETVGGDRQIIALHIVGDMADLHSVVSPQVVTITGVKRPLALRNSPHSTAPHRDIPSSACPCLLA